MLALTACSQGSDSESDDSSSSAGQAEKGAFPVTIKHALGETTIKSEPQRILTMDAESTDTALALGVVPTSIAAQDFGGDKEGYLPWTRKALDALVDTPPKTDVFFSETGEVDFEHILELAPDVILAPYSGFSQEDYERLSEIAPTVPFDYKPWQPSSWQNMTTSVGQALGRPARAAELIKQAEATTAQVAVDHPEFKDVSFIFGTYMREGETQTAVYSPADPRVKLVSDLGLTIAPDVLAGAKKDKSGSFTFGVSLEELDTVNADIYIGWAGEQADIDRSVGNALFAQWEPIKKGKDLWFTDDRLTSATMHVSVLSIPWTIDQLVPQLTEVIARP
ncbi:ABC transporter substrate-binding protein [Aeromicrobium sp. UC242_57]|uniref:ABC transporter substrate-binding protein n=1 Tax=Aeromicrobium sp. UC242_57 TaxID=3374624 RepID=UPI0037AB290D